MPLISQTQVLIAYRLLIERDEWYKENFRPMPADERSQYWPQHLLYKRIAITAGMSTKTLAMLRNEDFRICKWNPSKIKKWVKECYPTESSNQGIAGIFWRRENKR